MATPTIPASQSAAVKAAEIRADTSQEVAMLGAVARVLLSKREGYKDELVQVLRSLTTLETEMGKLGQDTFVKLADLQKDYYKTVSAGQVQPIDMVKYAVKLLELDKDTNVALGVKDNVLLDRARAAALVAGPVGSEAYKTEFVTTASKGSNAGLTSPGLVGTLDATAKELGMDVGSLPNYGGQDAAEAYQKYVDRKEAAAGIRAKSNELREALGDYGNLQALGLLVQGGNAAAIQTAAAAIAPTLPEALKYAEKFPGKDDISARLKGERDRATLLRAKLDEDPMAALESFRKSMSKTGEEERDVDFYKTIGSTKFQRWAASNNLMVGKMRPATTEADKTRVGYIEELNAVYEPGPDDQRALVVANNQLQMRPGSQLFTRRGLEGRRNVEVKIGTKGAERETMVDKAGNEVTPEQVAAQTTFTRVANVDGETVYIRADGSGISKTKQYTQDDLAYASEKPLTDAQAKQVGDSVRSSMFSTKKVAGEPSGVQTLRGRETAMLPSDPADTLYVIETTDGRRIPIRESQMLGETDISKGGVAPAGGPMKVVEEPRMALRKPLAMLRARGARLKEEKSAKGEEAEAPVGPLGRATDADKLLMSTAEVKALPGTQVVELPARQANEQLVSASRAPFTKTGIYEYEQRQAEAKEGLRVPLAEMRKKQALEELRVPLAEMRKKQAVDELGSLLAPTANAGRDVRKATGSEQTGKSAETVAASIPPIATGTPKNVPTYEVMQGNTKYTVDATPMFTPAELAEMNAPETPAQRAKRRAQVMGELRKKYGDNPATAPIP
jgi:hypothetical protein